MMIRIYITTVFVLFGGIVFPLPSSADDTAFEAMSEYMMFQDYQGGVILPRQIDKDIFNSVMFIDTRTAEQFSNSSIPGARHIEWREVLERLDDIPSDQKVILYCNTGVLSAQATFALRVVGRDNVVVLQGGYTEWLKSAGYMPQ